MPSNESNSSSPVPSIAPPGATPPIAPAPKRTSSLGVVVVALTLLAALVWWMSPGRQRFAPAPLRSAPLGCPTATPNFIPSDATEIPGVDWSKFTTAQRNHLLYRLNMEPCPCGCNSSVAACRLGHPSCPVCKGLVEKMIAEEGSTQTGDNSPK
jgi:hypothetical protein